MTFCGDRCSIVTGRTLPQLPAFFESEYLHRSCVIAGLNCYQSDVILQLCTLQPKTTWFNSSAYVNARFLLILGLFLHLYAIEIVKR